MSSPKIREISTEFYLKIVEEDYYFQFLVIAEILQAIAFGSRDHGDDGSNCILTIARFAVERLEMDLLSFKLDSAREGEDLA